MPPRATHTLGREEIHGVAALKGRQEELGELEEEGHEVQLYNCTYVQLYLRTTVPTYNCTSCTRIVEAQALCYEIKGVNDEEPETELNALKAEFARLEREKEEERRLKKLAVEELSSLKKRN